MNTLADLKPGESGVITDIRLTGAIKRRLLDLGFTAGTKITMIRRSPFGDPIEFYILNCSLCIRKSTANKILIERSGTKHE